MVITESLKARFLAKVDKSVGPDGCWPWTASLNAYGYGQLATGWKRPPVAAHRLSYELNVEPIPDGIFVLHRCDNPACVNPAHLFLGTQADNVADMISKGRNRTGEMPRGEGHHKTTLTADQVRDIRRRYADGETQTDIAEEFEISQPGISQIVRRVTWSHI